MVGNPLSTLGETYSKGNHNINNAGLEVGFTRNTFCNTKLQNEIHNLVFLWLMVDMLELERKKKAWKSALLISGTTLSTADLNETSLQEECMTLGSARQLSNGDRNVCV